MQLKYLNKPHFENGAIKNISKVLEEHGIKNPLICTDPGLSNIGMSDMIRNLLSNELSPSFYEDTPANPTEEAVNDALEDAKDTSAKKLKAVTGGLTDGLPGF